MNRDVPKVGLSQIMIRDYMNRVLGLVQIQFSNSLIMNHFLSGYIFEKVNKTSANFYKTSEKNIVSSTIQENLIKFCQQIEHFLEMWWGFVLLEIGSHKRFCKKSAKWFVINSHESFFLNLGFRICNLQRTSLPQWFGIYSNKKWFGFNSTHKCIKLKVHI